MCDTCLDVVAGKNKRKKTAVKDIMGKFVYK